LWEKLCAESQQEHREILARMKRTTAGAAPRFLADEDLRGSLVAAVKRHGRDLVFSTVNELGLRSVTDEQLLEFAWQHSWLVVSHDVNTMISVAESRIASAAGCRRLLLVNQWIPAGVFIDSLRLIQTASMLEEWENDIVYLPL